MHLTLPLKWSISILALGIVLVAASFLPFQAFFPSSAYYESRPNLANGATWIQQVGYFVSGSYVKLDVSVYGGDNKISAQVVDSDLTNITKEVIIDGNGVIALVIPKSGVYGLQIKNPDISSVNDEQVLIKSYYYFYNYIFLVPGVLLIIAGILLLIYFGLDVHIPSVRDDEETGQPNKSAHMVR